MLCDVLGESPHFCIPSSQFVTQMYSGGCMAENSAFGHCKMIIGMLT